MARHKTLRHLLDSFLLDAGLNTSPASNTSERPRLVRFIQRAYRMLWDRYDWPFKRIDVNVPLVPGQRFYDFPRQMGIDGVEDTHVLYSGVWFRILNGIDVTAFNTFDSLEKQGECCDAPRGERSDPVQRWAPYGDKQFEVWPIPASAQCIRFRGVLQCNQMIDDDDICLLDDDMVVAMALALRDEGRDIGQADKATTRARADNLFYQESARYTPRDQVYTMNGTTPEIGGGLYDPTSAFYAAIYAPRRS